MIIVANLEQGAKLQNGLVAMQQFQQQASTKSDDNNNNIAHCTDKINITLISSITMATYMEETLWL